METVSIMQVNAGKVITSNNILTSNIDNFISFIDRGEKTTKTYLNNLRQFVAYMRYKGITEPTRQDIIEYRGFLLSEHPAIKLDNNELGYSIKTDKQGNTIYKTCKPSTVKLYLQSVKQFFAWCATVGIYPNITINIHTPKIDYKKHKKEALEAQDVCIIENSIADRAENKILTAANSKKDTAGRIERATEQGKRLFAMYSLAVNCGLRVVELHRANIGDIETVGGTTYIYIWGKGHSEADTKKPIAKEVKEAIDDYLSCRTDSKTANSPLFTATGNRSKGKRIATTTISTMLKRALQEAGYDSDRITAHSLRHTTGTSTQEITNNIYLTQKYLRHSNPATTEIYLHNNTIEEEKKIAQQLYYYYHNSKQAAGI